MGNLPLCLPKRLMGENRQAVSDILIGAQNYMDEKRVEERGCDLIPCRMLWFHSVHQEIASRPKMFTPEEQKTQKDCFNLTESSWGDLYTTTEWHTLTELTDFGWFSSDQMTNIFLSIFWQ